MVINETQKELFDQFGFECDILKGYRAVIQNQLVNITEDDARKLIGEAKQYFDQQINKLQSAKYQIEEFIWSKIFEE